MPKPKNRSRVLRGYAAQLTGSLSSCTDGATVKIDWSTAHEVRKILLEEAKRLEEDNG